MKKFFSNIAKWSPLFLLYYLFDTCGNELGNAVAANMKARFNFAKAKAGYYAGRVGIITLILLGVGLWAYANLWYILSVICFLFLAAGYIVSLIIVKAVIPSDKKDSWGAVVNIFLYVGFLVLVVLPLTLATTVMPWNGLSVIPLYFYWVLAIVAYATILGGPISPAPLKWIMWVIGIIGFIYTVFLSNGAVGDAMEKLRESGQTRIAGWIASWSRDIDDQNQNDSPYAPTEYEVRAGAPIYDTRVAFGKVVSARASGKKVSGKTIVARVNNTSFIKGLEELYIVQFPDINGQYSADKGSWKAVARKDLASLNYLRKAKADSIEKALVEKRTAELENQTRLAQAHADSLRPVRVGGNFKPDPTTGMIIKVDNPGNRDVNIAFSSGDSFRTAWMGSDELLLKKPSLWFELVSEDGKPVSGSYDATNKTIKING